MLFFLFLRPCLRRHGHTPPLPRPFSSLRMLSACASAGEPAADSHYRTHALRVRKPRPPPRPAPSNGGRSLASAGWRAGPEREARAGVCVRARRRRASGAAALARDPERLGRLVAQSVGPRVPSWRTRPVRSSWAPDSPSCPSLSCM